MREITVGSSKERKVLKINIGEESYSLPLLGSLTIKEAKQLDTQDGTIGFIYNHIPKDVLDTLTVDNLNAIIKAWQSASDLEGISLGES